MKLISSIVLRFGPNTPTIGGESIEFRVFEGDPLEAPTNAKVLGGAPAVAWKLGRIRTLCDVAIADPMISGIHLSLIFDPAYGERGEPAWLISDGGYYPCDLKRKGGDLVTAGYRQSSGGTWLNGEQLGAETQHGQLRPTLKRIYPQDRILLFPSVKILVFEGLHETELPCDVWEGDWRDHPVGELISSRVANAIADTPQRSEPWFVPLLRAVWDGPYDGAPKWVRGLWRVGLIASGVYLAPLIIEWLVK